MSKQGGQAGLQAIRDRMELSRARREQLSANLLFARNRDLAQRKQLAQEQVDSALRGVGQ